QWFRDPKEGITRRALLAAAASLAAPAFAAPRPRPAGARAPAPPPAPGKPAARARPAAGPPGIPGPLPGRVIEVGHPGSVVEGKVVAERIRAMMARGICELTGAADESAAWRRFFGPGDIVGIKVCPVGRPRSISQPETLLEVIRGLGL